MYMVGTALFTWATFLCNTHVNVILKLYNVTKYFHTKGTSFPQELEVQSEMHVKMAQIDYPIR